MIPTSIFALRPYKYVFILELCVFALCSFLLTISLLLFFVDGTTELILPSGIVFVFMLMLFLNTNRARKIEVVFNTNGFEIHNDHGRSFNGLWSEHKGIYLAKSTYSRQYVLILRNEHSMKECERICNRLDFKLGFGTVVNEGFAVYLPTNEGEKLKDIIPFSS